MKPPYRIETDVDPPIRCHSIEDVDSNLARLQQEYLGRGVTSVVISESEQEFGHGDEIGLGLGCDPTFILVQVVPCDGEYYISAGDPDAEGEVTFYGARELINVERRNFVPWSLVRQSVREYLEHHRRSDLIGWRDWSGRGV